MGDDAAKQITGGNSDIYSLRGLSGSDSSARFFKLAAENAKSGGTNAQPGIPSEGHLCWHENTEQNGPVTSSHQDACIGYDIKGGIKLHATGHSFSMTNKGLNKYKPYGAGAEMGMDTKLVSLEGGVSADAKLTNKEGNISPYIKGEIKGGAIAAEANLRGKIGVFPSRWVDSACGRYDGRHSMYTTVSDLCDAVSKKDYGISLNGNLGGTVGYAVGVDGQLGVKDGRARAGVTVKVSPGLGGTIGGGMDIGAFDKDE